MRPIIGEKRTMTGAAIMNEAKAAAVAMVAREEARTGSRMVAYEIVAQTVGTSGEWLRKFVNGYRGVPNLIVGFNLIQQYNLVCERVENNAKNKREKTDALLRQFYAANPGSTGMVETASAPQASGPLAEEDE